MKQIKFNGSGSEYFKIWIVNALLCIVTFGIYYPWAKVRTRRYFYANTEYENRFFDYHATGKQLFLGYLIGVSILIVINVIQTFLPIVGGILLIALFVGVPWIIWRSLRFNMRMTSFSNVRFSFVGDLKTSYFIYMLLPVLGYSAVGLLIFGGVGIALLFPDTSSDFLLTLSSILTGLGSIIALILGVYLAGLFKKKASEYQVSQTKFGQGRFFTQFETGKFININIKTFFITLGLIAILGIILVTTLVAVTGGFNTDAMVDDVASGSASPLLGLFIFLIYAGFIAAFIFSGVYAYSRQRQYIYANTTLDNAINFKSTVSAKHYFIIIITNMLMVLFTFGLASPWARVRAVRYLVENTWIDAKDIDINGYLTQKEAEQSAIGEEIGDVLDIDMDIAL